MALSAASARTARSNWSWVAPVIEPAHRDHDCAPRSFLRTLPEHAAARASSIPSPSRHTRSARYNDPRNVPTFRQHLLPGRGRAQPRPDPHPPRRSDHERLRQHPQHGLHALTQHRQRPQQQHPTTPQSLSGAPKTSSRHPKCTQLATARNPAWSPCLYADLIRSGPAAASSTRRCEAPGACQPVIRASTARAGRFGPRTTWVHP